MKLKIRRNQAAITGFFGGHKGMSFSLSCQVEISSSDKELIDKYKVRDYVLAYREENIDGRVLNVPVVTVNDLVNGYSVTLGDVGELLKREKIIKTTCKKFVNLLLVMASFGGEEVIDIDELILKDSLGEK